MNGVITAFKNWKKDAEADAYYLFIVPKFSEGGVEGFMPRNRRFGFITQEQLVPCTVAHELGHGAFNLRHTFPEAPQGSTDNLMDYAGGMGLYKPQWDLIHNPELTTGLWDEMEDGAMGVFGVTWLGNILWGLAPDDQERQIEKDLALYDHVYQNFDNYLNESNSKNVNIKIEKYKEWSIRQESKSGIARKVFEGVKDERSTFSLWTKGIYMEEYTLKEKRYKLCIYSNIQDINIDKKVRLKTPDELRYCKYLKLGYTDNYGLIVFYNNDGKMSMVIQIYGGNTIKETTTQWGNYLGLLLPEIKPSEDKSKSLENLVKPTTIHDTEELTEIWDGENQEQSSMSLEYNKKVNIPVWRSQFGYFCGQTPNDCYSNGCTQNCKIKCIYACNGMVGYTIYEDDQHSIYTRSGVGILPEITKGKFDTEKDNFQNLLIEIQKSLNDNVAIVAGVFKKAKIDFETSNKNKATHHFIVVVGMTINGNNGQLFYHEVGALSSDLGELQILNIDISKMLINGRSKYLEMNTKKVDEDNDYPLYILTEIRVKPKYRISIKQ